jgi:predicted GIY-YIG superfamily endonuclease
LKFAKENPSMWWVYVLLSCNGKTYVGSTTDPYRRIRQHNGEIRGGAKCTRGGRPWTLEKVYGPYENRSQAFRAELALKHGKRGKGRFSWSKEDSEHFRESAESASFCVNEKQEIPEIE